MPTRLIHSSWWIDFRHEGERYRKRSPDNSRTGAKAYELVLRGRLARGEDVVKKQNSDMPTFQIFSNQWQETYVRSNNKPSEQQSKYYILSAHLVPFFGKMGLDKISTLAVEGYKAEKLRSGCAAPKTINNQLAVLNTCLRYGKELGIIDSVPIIRMLNVPPQKYYSLTEQESANLLEAITDPVWHDMVYIALQTGMRIGELLGLEWQDVDFITQIISVKRSIVKGVTGSPKSNKVRYIPFSAQTGEVLQKWRKVNGPVFTKVGSPINQKSPYRALWRYRDRAGLPRVGWHTFRHTFASQLATKGVHIRSIQELLGHSDIRMTMRYAHLQESTLRQAIEVLDFGVPANFGQQVVNSIPNSSLAQNSASL